MASKVIQREIAGVKYYLTESDNWTPDKNLAKEYKGKFWIELLKILFEIAKYFKLTNLKYVNK